MRRTKEITAVLLSLIIMMGMGSMAPSFAAAPGNDADAAAAEGAGQSADNSLSSLSLSEGTLSPEFQYNITDYTAEVGGDVSSVEVNAKLSNEKAVIESITGNTDLKEGKNTISIVVKAENGMAATYKIVVTRGGTSQGEAGEGEKPKETEDQGTDAPEGGQENPGGITINGHLFNLSATVPEDAVPKDFTKTSVDCQGQQVEGLKFDKGALTLVYLTTPSKDVKNTLAVYNEAGNTFYPFRRVALGEEKYMILLDPPAESGLSQEYTLAAQFVGGFEDVPVYSRGDAVPQAGNGAGSFQGAEEQKGAADVGFCLVYAASSFGNIGWYQYDGSESTFQRFVTAQGSQTELSGEEGEGVSAEMQALQNAYKDLEEKYNKKKESSGKTTAVLIFIIAVLAVVVINLAVRGRREDDDMEDEDDEEEEYGGLPAWLRGRSGKRETMRKRELESRRKSRMEKLNKEDSVSQGRKYQDDPDSQETERGARKQKEGAEPRRRPPQPGRQGAEPGRRTAQPKDGKEPQRGSLKTGDGSEPGRRSPQPRDGMGAGRTVAQPGQARASQSAAARNGAEPARRNPQSGLKNGNQEPPRGGQEYRSPQNPAGQGMEAFRSAQPGQEVPGRRVSQETKVMPKTGAAGAPGRHLPGTQQPPRNHTPKSPVSREVEDDFEVIDLEDL